MVHFCFNLPFSSQKNSSTLLHTFRMQKNSTRHTTNTNPVPPTVEPWEVGCCSFWDSGGFEKMRIENWRRLWINSRIMWRTPSSNPMLKPWFLVLLQFVPFGAQAPVHVTKKNPCLNGNYPICHGDRKHLKMLLIPRKRNWYVPSQKHQCLFAQANSLCAWADTNRWLYLICIF